MSLCFIPIVWDLPHHKQSTISNICSILPMPHLKKRDQLDHAVLIQVKMLFSPVPPSFFLSSSVLHLFYLFTFFFVQDDSTGLTHSVVGCRTWHPWPVQQCLLCDIVKCLIILLTYWVVFWVACGSAKMLSLKQKVWLVSLQSLGKISALSEGANCFAH